MSQSLGIVLLNEVKNLTSNLQTGSVRLEPHQNEVCGTVSPESSRTR